MDEYLDYYLQVNKQFGLIIEKSLENENISKHAKVASFLEDYFTLKQMASDEIDVIFSEAYAEYRTMLLFMCMGLYKNAYMSLRGYFELTLFGISVSVSDISFRKWKIEKLDIIWRNIIDSDAGIFSIDFIETYYPELIEYGKEMTEEAKCYYRICSEFIHSGYKVAILDEKTEFNQEYFDRICEVIQAINKIITFAFVVRYGDEISHSEDKDRINTIIDEYIPEINKILK